MTFEFIFESPGKPVKQLPNAYDSNLSYKKKIFDIFTCKTPV